MVVKQQSRFQSQNIQFSFMYINLPQIKQTSFKGLQDQNWTLSPLQATLFENTVLDVLKFTGLHSHCLLLNIKSDSVEKNILFLEYYTLCQKLTIYSLQSTDTIRNISL